MKNFALIGAAGYIAPRHMKAIKDTGNNLLTAYDPFDSVGILDDYFPKADFFTEFERFDRHLEKLKRNGITIDYVSICSPNYLHDAHVRYGLRLGAKVICEKPLVLNPWNVDALEELEKEYNGSVFNILQLRLHQDVIQLKKKIESGPEDHIYNVKLNYHTSRGNWYHHSWKGDLAKSGGIATNIGIHFFDILLWIFGKVESSQVEVHNKSTAAGRLRLKNAIVHWLLSIDHNTIPEEMRNNGVRTYRSIDIDGEEFEFSGGFTELHTTSYREILNNRGFRISEVRNVIELVCEIRGHNDA